MEKPARIAEPEVSRFLARQVPAVPAIAPFTAGIACFCGIGE